MLTGRYRQMTDVAEMTVEISQVGARTFSVEMRAAQVSMGAIGQRGEWTFVAQLIRNSLNQNVHYYAVCLNFNDGKLKISEAGKNPFFGPKINFAGTYHKVEVAVA